MCGEGWWWVVVVRCLVVAAAAAAVARSAVLSCTRVSQVCCGAFVHGYAHEVKAIAA